MRTGMDTIVSILTQEPPKARRVSVSYRFLVSQNTVRQMLFHRLRTRGSERQKNRQKVTLVESSGAGFLTWA